MKKNHYDEAIKEQINHKLRVEKHEKSWFYRTPLFFTLSIIMPLVPSRSGSRFLLENYSYTHAVIIYALFYLTCYSILHIYQKDQLDKKSKELKLKVYLTEKEMK